MRKRNLFLIAVVGFLLVFLLLVFFKPAKVDLGNSTIYSVQELQLAADMVEAKVDEFTGCKLFAISYAGDTESMAEAGYDQEREAIVMRAVFMSPLRRIGAWNPHQIYTWRFIIMQTEESPWELTSWGEA